MGNKKPRVAILTEDEYVWSFDIWKRTIPILRNDYDVAMVGLVPPRLGKRRGWRIPWWYLTTFGVKDFVLLSLFSLIRIVKNRGLSWNSWGKLAKRYKAGLLFVDNPNDEACVSVLAKLRPDIIVVMSGFILKKPFIQSARVAVVNKHAALLPCCRGVFPFIWGVIKRCPLGVSFHIVDEQIDHGRVLWRKKIEPKPRTMVEFYDQVFQNFPNDLLASLSNMRQHKQQENNGYKQSYCGFPTASDIQRFRSMGGEIICLSDIFHIY